MARRHEQVAGWNSGGSVEEGYCKSRRVGSRASGVAPSPRKQVARHRHDPDESQGHQNGRRRYDTHGPGNVTEVVTHVKQVRKEGMGVVSMKLVGEGTFSREDRKAAMRFAFKNAGVDCVTVATRTLQRSTRRSRI